MGTQPECLNSDKCKLWQFVENPYIPLTGNRKNPKVLFVGEAPGGEEDAQNANFVGEAGQILRSVISEVGFDWSDIAISNVVKCRTKKEWDANRTPTISEISTCKPHVLAEIEVLKPRIVVVLGNSPLKGLLDETGITGKRGRVYEKDGIIYVPTFHPSSINYDPTKLDFIVKDLELVYKLLQGERPEIEAGTYHLLDTVDKIKWFANKKLAYATEMFYDLETSRLSPYYKNSFIVCASVAFVEREAFVLPLQHSHQIFTGKTLETVKLVLKEIMESDLPKSAQNAKFDTEWLDVALNITVKNLVFDTMLAQYLLSEERGTNNLDYMTMQYTKMGAYFNEMHAYVASHKEADPKRGGSYANVPWSVLVPYSAGDSDSGLRCKHVLEKMLK